MKGIRILECSVFYPESRTLVEIKMCDFVNKTTKKRCLRMVQKIINAKNNRCMLHSLIQVVKNKMAKPDFGTQKKIIAIMKRQGYTEKVRLAVLELYC